MKFRLDDDIKDEVAKGKLEKRDGLLKQLAVNSQNCEAELAQLRGQMSRLQAAVSSIQPAKKNDDLSWITFD